MSVGAEVGQRLGRGLGAKLGDFVAERLGRSVGDGGLYDDEPSGRA